jgi:hypothetical protein
MKGGIEFALIMLFGMMFTALAMGMIGILAQLHDARLLQETVVSAIEHQSTEAVSQQFENRSICPECQISIERKVDQRVQVTIIFPIRIPVIDYLTFAKISAMTIPIN